MNPKPVVWIGTSYDDLREFPSDVQDDLGYALYLAQIGEFAEKAKPMHGSLRDVVEIVAIDADGTYRLMYTIKLGDTVYVLHAFQKKAKRGVRDPQKRDRTHRTTPTNCEDQAWKPRSLRANLSAPAALTCSLIWVCPIPKNGC